uniref:Uncharacterized protein n=1 Tax=Rhizophora mucronata TaxID=61149 RepID=A0A2P2QNS7_RHIMU
MNSDKDTLQIDIEVVLYVELINSSETQSMISMIIRQDYLWSQRPLLKGVGVLESLIVLLWFEF